MRMLSVIIILSLSILSALSAGPVYAWTSYTHDWICERINLTDTDCAAADSPKVQSQHPDLNFRYHHCAGGAYDCDARTHAEAYLEYSYPEAKGYAAHLYADSMVPVHWYSTDYDTCHKIFEDLVEEKLQAADDVRYDLFRSSYDMSAWNVSMSCPAKFGNEYRNVTLYADHMYMQMTAKYVADQMKLGYTAPVIRTVDLTPLIYLLIGIMVVIFTVFVYFGMKNRRR